MMPLARVRSLPRQVSGDTPAVLGEVLRDGVNLAIWQRAPGHRVRAFAEAVIGLPTLVDEKQLLALDAGDVSPVLQGLLSNGRALPGHADFIADVGWLVDAYACLLGARCVGLRLRVLESSMCPRFHVDHVPLRLITTYVGVGSQWLEESAMPRARLGDVAAEPSARLIRQLACGDVALFKGEKWAGNEGAGIVHRSPQPAAGHRRLIMTLDWLS